MGRTTFEKRVRKHYWLIALAVLLGIVLIVAAVLFFLFHVEYVEVNGNVHYSEEDIEKLTLTGKLDSNSLYLHFFKKELHFTDVPFLDSVRIKMINRNTILIDVTEKSLVGYVQDANGCWYFDRDGVVLERTDEPRQAVAKEETAGTSDANSDLTSTTEKQDGVLEAQTIEAQPIEDLEEEVDETAVNNIPQVTGLEYSSIETGKLLVVSDMGIFQTIDKVTKLTNQNNILPDLIQVGENNTIQLIYGNNTIDLGIGLNMEKKILQLAAILPQMDSLSGTLHLENYDGSQKNIIFEKNS